jgi:hypothetical protein
MSAGTCSPTAMRMTSTYAGMVESGFRRADDGRAAAALM